MNIFSSILSAFEEMLLATPSPQVGQYAVQCPDGWRPKAIPTAKAPKVEKKRRTEESNDDLYTDDEIAGMSDAEFSIKVGGAKSKGDFYRKAESTATKRQTTFDFEADDMERHGITDREYACLLAYDPPLTDLELAARVKMAIAKGEALTKFAERAGIKYQLARHYSAALKRAK